MGWRTEIWAMVRKEWMTERRDRSASYVALMLSLTTVFTLAFAFSGRVMSAAGAAGMLWAAIMFAGVGALARAFVAEDERGTGDLLRLWARPHAVFWGKAVFALAQMTITTVLVSLFFLLLAGVEVKVPGLLAVALMGTAAVAAGTVTLASALVSRGQNRGSLVGVVSLPLLVPLVALGVSAGRSAIEGVSLDSGAAAAGGIWLYAVATFAVAPHLFAAIWREP